jgi:hypothetical protein
MDGFGGESDGVGSLVLVGILLACFRYIGNEYHALPKFLAVVMSCRLCIDCVSNSAIVEGLSHQWG